mmetsp:Transcript_28933/g.61116  ORF Transcript_28933/g.61116 Transcript_28933/m.61116 type:complete len:266 (-) Transcript_28933:126-923(-)
MAGGSSFDLGSSFIETGAVGSVEGGVSPFISSCCCDVTSSALSSCCTATSDLDCNPSILAASTSSALLSDFSPIFDVSGGSSSEAPVALATSVVSASAAVTSVSASGFLSVPCNPSFLASAVSATLSSGGSVLLSAAAVLNASSVPDAASAPALFFASSAWSVITEYWAPSFLASSPGAGTLSSAAGFFAAASSVSACATASAGATGSVTTSSFSSSPFDGSLEPESISVGMVDDCDLVCGPNNIIVGCNSLRNKCSFSHSEMVS